MMRYAIGLLGCLVAGLVGFMPCQALIQIDPASGQFVDVKTGNTHIYHGVNVVYKTHPYLPCYDCPFDPQLSLNDEDIKNMKSWGINMVRLGIMWVAVEPEPGVYNYTFLAEARKLVQALGDAGVVALVDMHQDIFSPSTCGEGFPDDVAAAATYSYACNASSSAEFAHAIGVCKSIMEFDMRIDPKTGYPLVEDCLKHEFGFFYPTPEVSSAFQSLYENRKGIRDRFVDYWRVTASAFANLTDAVLGYDLINEPWVGDLWQDLGEILLPGKTDRTYLQPMYSELNAAIRVIDRDHLMFYEGTPIPDILPIAGGIPAPVGFNSTPGLDPSRDVLSYHIYCCQSGAGACDKDGNPVDSAVCDKFNPKNVEVREEDRKRLGGGAFLSEFGACTTGDACLAEIERTTNAADSALHGWAYWQFKYFNDITTSSGPAESFYNPATGDIFEDKVAALARPYAPTIQGVATKMSWDAKSGQFHLEYRYRPTAQYQTQIYVNNWAFPGSAMYITVQPEGYFEPSWQSRNILTFVPQQPLDDGSTVTIHLTRTDA